MSLAEQIIDDGPYAAGDVLPEWMFLPNAADFNEIREELLELRRLRAQAEALGRYTAEAVTPYPGTADIALHHDCRAWWVDIDGPRTLAELNQRADEHTEVCR